MSALYISLNHSILQFILVVHQLSFLSIYALSTVVKVNVLRTAHVFHFCAVLSLSFFFFLTCKISSSFTCRPPDKC